MHAKRQWVRTARRLLDGKPTWYTPAKAHRTQPRPIRPHYSRQSRQTKKKITRGPGKALRSLPPGSHRVKQPLSSGIDSPNRDPLLFNRISRGMHPYTPSRGCPVSSQTGSAGEGMGKKPPVASQLKSAISSNVCVLDPERTLFWSFSSAAGRKTTTTTTITAQHGAQTDGHQERYTQTFQTALL